MQLPCKGKHNFLLVFCSLTYWKKPKNWSKYPFLWVKNAKKWG